MSQFLKDAIGLAIGAGIGLAFIHYVLAPAVEVVECMGRGIC